MQKDLFKNWKLIGVVTVIVLIFGYVGLSQRDQPYGGTTYWNKIFGKKFKLEPLSTRGLPVPATDVPVILPPDPGEAGKATLAGIDSDHDGVRDDLQREIVYMYPQNEQVRRVLTAMVKKEQGMITTTGDHEYFKGLMIQYFAFRNCYEYLVFRSNKIVVNSTNGDILWYTNQNTPERKKIIEDNQNKALPFASDIHFNSEACTQPLVQGQY